VTCSVACEITIRQAQAKFVFIGAACQGFIFGRGNESFAPNLLKVTCNESTLNQKSSFNAS
jgi:hypothetical protein